MFAQTVLKLTNNGGASAQINHLKHYYLLHALPPPTLPLSLHFMQPIPFLFSKVPFGTNDVFKYSVRYAFIDLDLAPHPPPDHLSPQQARSIAHTNGPVFLLTIPPSVGYEQNPLSLYYCYDVEGSTKCLKRCIADVTNTPWGERVQFLFNPDSDVVAKPLHVSPFMDMLGNWRIKTSVPGDNLVVNISVNHPKLSDYFTASLTAKRVSSSSVQHAVFFWLMPHKVAIWIYWHALKLWWKKVAFIQHPRYENPSYKKDATARDRNLGCCQAFSVQTNNQPQLKQKDRWFRWRDAKWPWC